MEAPVTIAGLTAPHSDLARKAASLVERVHSKPLLNHVHRSWWFAEFLGRKRIVKYDRELVYVASLLHDLGLTETYMGQERFEVDSADAACRWLKDQGYAQDRAEIAWQAIALHSSVGIVDRLAPELALVSFGAHMDIFGMRLDELTPDIIDDTLQLYPRLGMKAAFTAALAEVARRKPLLAAGTGVADVGHRHVHEFSCPNICDMIQNAPFDS